MVHLYQEGLLHLPRKTSDPRFDWLSKNLLADGNSPDQSKELAAAILIYRRVMEVFSMHYETPKEVFGHMSEEVESQAEVGM